MRPALLVLAVILAGCLHAAPPPAPGGPAAPAPSAARLFDLAAAQVLDDHGAVRYRVPGTPGSVEVAGWIASLLAAENATVRIDSFTAAYRCQGATPMRNVEGILPGATNRTIWLGAHYDTRPVAEKDPHPAKRSQPVPGANDGASGVAVVLELARLLDDLPRRNFTYGFLLFDAEDGGATTPGEACNARWALGSEHHARAMTAEAVRNSEALLLFDLVGDRNLTLQREGYSAGGPGRPIQDRLWEIGKAKGHGRIFSDVRNWEILDDHKAYLDRGIPAVDLIHLDGGADPFPETHHTTFDDLAHLSGESLRIVADVAWAWILEREGGS